MSPARKIFMIAFALFVGITLVVPSFPPAQMLYRYISTQQSTLSLSGISITTILNGITNGFFWTIIAFAAYNLVQYMPVHTKEPTDAEFDIETIKGIGPVRGALFKNSGIETVDDLLRVGATESGRHRLADEIGVDSATVLTWTYRGDSLRMKGRKRTCDKNSTIVKHDNKQR